jgi:hypothetical protein
VRCVHARGFYINGKDAGHYEERDQEINKSTGRLGRNFKPKGKWKEKYVFFLLPFAGHVYFFVFLVY